MCFYFIFIHFFFSGEHNEQTKVSQVSIGFNQIIKDLKYKCYCYYCINKSKEIYLIFFFSIVMSKGFLGGLAWKSLESPVIYVRVVILYK